MINEQPMIFTVQPKSDVAFEKPAKTNIKDEKFFGKLNKNSKEKTFCQKTWILQSSNKVELDDDDRHILCDGCFGPLTQAVLIVASFSVTFIPVHNVILYPDIGMRWYCQQQTGPFL